MKKILIIVLVLGVAAVAYFVFFSKSTSKKIQQGIIPLGSAWEEGGAAVGGQFADAEVVDLGNGKWRMYYSVEPEVKGNKLELYSATSGDGINWSKESGVRKEFATFPDVVKLPNSKGRLYFQNMGVIKSAVSDDGLSWKDEPGTRIDNKEVGFSLDTVGAQTTTQLADGSFIMVYRGAENKPYGSEKLPNQNTSYLFYAVSQDGVNFTKKGMAMDSRNETLKGFIDGPEWVKWDNGELRLYFWSYRGVYHSVYQNNKFSQPEFDFSNSPDVPFPPSPPSDPTLAKINGQWFMYYGQHTKGIYYATQK